MGSHSIESDSRGGSGFDEYFQMGHGLHFSDSPAPLLNHGFLDLAPEAPSSHTAKATSPGGFLFFLFLVHWFLRTNSLDPGMVLMTHFRTLKRCCCLNCNFLFVHGKGPPGLIMPFLLKKKSQETLKKMRSPQTWKRDKHWLYFSRDEKGTWPICKLTVIIGSKLLYLLKYIWDVGI